MAGEKHGVIGAVRTRTGAEIPVLGLGTWRMGEDSSRRKLEVQSLQLGLDLGLTLVDTAEMYADGEAETVVRDAIRGRREEVFLVSKVLPQNASREGTVRAAERSLKRLGTDWLDLYLLHWPGRYPLEETYRAFDRLASQGKVRHYGVSNFDVAQMEESDRTPAGRGVSVNQVLYNLQRRGIEGELLPWCSSRGIAVMAYSPLEQGSLSTRGPLRDVAARHDATPWQIALAWTLRHDGVVTIVKTSSPDRVRENAKAADVTLNEEDLRELDRAYPAPSGGGPLEML